MKKISLALSAAMLSFAILSCQQAEKKNTNETPEPGQQTTEKEAVGNPAGVKTDSGPFELEPLNYGYADLEKAIDAKTMEVHYSKHYLGYANNLNKEVQGKPQASQSIEQILQGLDMKNATLRNNGGGYYNHRLYFAIMSPNGGGQPSGALAEAVNKEFGSFESLKDKLSEAATKRFGSGWAWLVVTKNGRLAVGSTANQDTPLMPGLDISGTPILGIDVWEHAYYLRYQNKRPDYINAFFEVVDWNVVGENYSKALSR